MTTFSATKQDLAYAVAFDVVVFVRAALRGAEELYAGVFPDTAEVFGCCGARALLLYPVMQVELPAAVGCGKFDRRGVRVVLGPVAYRNLMVFALGKGGRDLRGTADRVDSAYLHSANILIKSLICYLCAMLTALQDTICAPATGTGGAIAIVRVSGSKSLECVDAVVSLRRGRVCEAPGYSLRYGSVEGLDEVMVSVFRAPHSYTGEDSAEISCHASPYIVGELLGRLCEAGCRMAEPGEFTQRAFLNGKMDLAQAESVADLIASDSKAAHDLALRQLQGSYSSEFRELRDQLLRLSSLLELELDFSEEELEFADRSELESLTREALARVEKLRDSYRLGNAIKAGVPVAIVGEPNAGKSTLLNVLLGEDRAIVSPVAGTTRDTVEEVMVLGGVKFRFIDTAGLRETSDPVERLGVERSLQKLRSASIVLSLVDCRQYREGMRWPGEEFCGDAVPGGGAMLLKVLSKCDLAEDAGDSCGAIRISAKTGLGMAELRAALLQGCGLASDWAESSIVSSARHRESLCAAALQLGAVLDAMRLGLPADLLAEHLRAATAAISGIIGEISTDQVLGEIFSKFCIGK